MRIICFVLTMLIYGVNVCAMDISAESLSLNDEQTQYLEKLNQNLKTEIEPIKKNIEAEKEEILAIQKRYFQSFWNTLTQEQRDNFAKQQKNE